MEVSIHICNCIHLNYFSKNLDLHTTTTVSFQMYPNQYSLNVVVVVVVCVCVVHKQQQYAHI